MRLERSTTWMPGKTAWRVRTWYFHWGPWCYSRTDAWIQWVKSFSPGQMTWPFIRLWRWSKLHCLVCGGKARGCHELRYCSDECAILDRALLNPSRKWIVFGIVQDRPRTSHVEPSTPWPRV